MSEETIKEDRHLFFEFTLIECLVIITVLSFIVSIAFNIKVTINGRKLQQTLYEISKYKIAVDSFKEKYGALPGDVSKTQIFDISNNNSDGNMNNIIEDTNQMSGIMNEPLRYNGEIANFFIHLYNSGFLRNENKANYPILDIYNSGVLVVSINNNNYFILSVYSPQRNEKIQIRNILTPHSTFLIDKKIDDGFPFSGNVLGYGGVNITTDNEINRKCATGKEYLTYYNKEFCQLIINLKF
jgi:hypothetical protein